MKRFLLFILAALICVACGGKVDPYKSDIGQIDREMFTIPPGCESYYEHATKVVAVTPFANNTSFQDGYREFEQAAVAIGFNGAAAVYTKMAQDVVPQLSEFAQSAVETAIVDMGGASVVSRNQMQDILTEQQFQMTIADPNTAVEFGRLTGAQYIISGAVNNVSLKYTAPIASNYDTSTPAGMIMALGSSMYNALATGWNVNSVVNINVIDVSTGQIVASQRSEGTANMGNAPSFTVDQAIAGAKKAMENGMYKTISFLNNYFETRGYINELRGDKSLALISLGLRNGVQEGDTFTVMDMVQQTDFRTGLTSCGTMESALELRVTSAIGEDFAWAEVRSGNKNLLSKLKIGSLVLRTEVRR